MAVHALPQAKLVLQAFLRNGNGRTTTRGRGEGCAQATGALGHANGLGTGASGHRAGHRPPTEPGRKKPQAKEQSHRTTQRVRG